ncbi:MAG TPA: hypothetical protein VK658_07030 [Chryseolinea sp.]|nr:hypothetical protein [Chryseolinea sp.]
MTIDINTTATNGHLLVYVLNSNGGQMLTIRDSGSGSCMLVPGKKYRFEWHTWSATPAEYAIDASVNPSSPGFPPLHFDVRYATADEDFGTFEFTA